MKWVMKDPVRGDMIRVALGSIYHFGIYVSDEEVIQFGLAPSQRAMLRDSEVEVVSSDIDGFLAGGFLEVCEFDKKERKKHRSPDAVVAYAQSKLGMRGYNILYNNCEHFANECLSGEHICHQADDVRAMFRNMPIVDVYVAVLPDREIGEPLSCRPRWAEIVSLSHERLKREKYYVWKLLEYGLERSFGLKMRDLVFKKEENGRYSADKVEFSLSHSQNILAVAVSRGAVGVDVEAADADCRQGMAERALTPREYAFYNRLPDEEKAHGFLRLWTAKEALFKASHGDRFDPAALETIGGQYRTFDQNAEGIPYILSVATATPDRIRMFENVKL